MSGQQRVNRTWATAAVILAAVLSATGADLYWDTDTDAPLVGNGSPESLSGSFFSTAPSGDTALTTIGNFNNIYFQTDTIKSYTNSLDTVTNVLSLTVDNGNDVTITSSAAQLIAQSNAVTRFTVKGGSSLTWQHVTGTGFWVGGGSDAPFIDLGTGTGDNSLVIQGQNSTQQYWISGVSGDAGDRFGTFDNSYWIRCNDTYTYGGELVGEMRFSPGTITLTADSDDFYGRLDGGTVTLGDGGTSGSIGTADLVLGTLKFNRSDDYMFTNNIVTWVGKGDLRLSSLGSGTPTIVSDLNGAGCFITGGGNGVIRGNVDITHRWWNTMTGTWTLVGTNACGANLNYNPSFRINSGAIQLGDGSVSSSLTVFRDFRCYTGASLIMDIRGGDILLNATAAMIADAGTTLEIIGDGQETPIITYAGTLTPFENVVYNGMTHTWAEAQMLKALGGVTQMRVEDGAIYIDPLGPTGTVILVR